MIRESRGKTAGGHAAARIGVRQAGSRFHAGTSLVEILVALVVLVIGIFSLVRLFPLGFGSILYGENVTRGDALTRSELERVRAAAQNLPDGIAPITPETGLVDLRLPKEEELAPWQPNPNLPPDPRFSGVNRFRRVFGETTKIPAPTSDSPYLPIVNPNTGEREAVSLYSVQFSPIYSPASVTVYSGTPLKRVVMERPPTPAALEELGDTSYGIDYRNGVLYFAPATYDRVFRVEFAFTIPQGGNSFVRGGSVPGAAIPIPATVTRFDLRGANLLPQNAQLEVEEDRVFRVFRQRQPAEPFSRLDPYEFKVLNTLVGLIGFNPLGSAPSSRFGGGGQSLLAKIDYEIEDWHIIREDRVVPQTAPFTLNLTLNFIKRFGDIEATQQQYFGLIRDYSAAPILPDPRHLGTPGIDLVLVDLDTGLTIDSKTLQLEPNPAFPVSSLNGRIDYNRGRIEFNSIVQWTLPNGELAPPSSIAGRRVRVYYRTEADWALQITKASSSYRRELEPARMGYGQYLQNRAELFFLPIDHDQSVLVDYTWVQLLQGGGKRLRQESGELHRIKAPTAPDSPQTLAGGIPGLENAWWIRLNVAGRPDVAPDEPIVIQSVRGASVTARALWREGDRWRRLEHTTLLPR